jgi:hypothetical protein
MNKNKKSQYETLGVVRYAPIEVIKAAYQTLARLYHPDRNPGDREAAAKMASINAAYDILSDGAKRAQYDAELLLDETDREPKSGAGPSPKNSSPDMGSYQSPPFLERFALLSVLIVTVIVFVATMASLPPTGFTRSNQEPSQKTDEVEPIESTEANAPCWKHKNGHVTCQARDPMGGATSEDATKHSYIAAITDTKYFLETLVGGIVLCVSLFAWWLFTRRAPLRNNILIGLCALGAFVVNSIAGAVVVAAWIISSRLPLLPDKRSASK